MMYIEEQTFDDLMHVTSKMVIEKGEHVTASRGGNIELMGVSLTLVEMAAKKVASAAAKKRTLAVRNGAT